MTQRAGMRVMPAPNLLPLPTLLGSGSREWLPCGAGRGGERGWRGCNQSKQARQAVYTGKGRQAWGSSSWNMYSPEWTPD